jgi:hypothetical protein
VQLSLQNKLESFMKDDDFELPPEDNNNAMLDMTDQEH